MYHLHGCVLAEESINHGSHPFRVVSIRLVAARCVTRPDALAPLRNRKSIISDGCDDVWFDLLSIER
jgi:hypothetical protein